MERQPEAAPSTGPSTAPDSAPEHALPPAHFYSIEYPGYVKPASVPLAIDRLGGQQSVEHAFKRVSSKTESLLELRLRPGNPFAHPVPGDVVPTNNILLKVTKRRRKRKSETGDALDTAEEKGKGNDVTNDVVGEYTVEAAGVIVKTARFRSMVDYQFQPDMSDPLAKLRSAMDNMDVEGILSYNIPEEKEEYLAPSDRSATPIDPQLISQDDAQPAHASFSQEPRSNLRLFPPPLFSRQGISQNYNYKANPASVVTTVVDEETGEEKKRLINRMRWKGYGPVSIMFADKTVPDKASPAVEEQRGKVDQTILKRLQELFRERPIWTRAAIFNQFSPLEVREIVNSKVLLPLVSYVFVDGPWRDTQVRLSYDPRQDKRARFYQRLYFRNTNRAVERASITTKRQEGRTEIAQNRTIDSTARTEDKRSHIFDGVTSTKETAAFQLCDIEDPMLKEMIEDEEDLRETCNEREGWYTTYALERIKAVLRYKFFELQNGYVPTREECEALLVPHEGTNKLVTRSTQRLRPGKHNMAKGAMRPEDAAAHRLIATIQQQAKDHRSQDRH